MKTLSALATSVHASTTIAIDTKFQKMRADGIDVIGFGMGQPDFDTPEHIKEAGIQAIRDNVTKYTPTAGTLEVRRAVCHRLAEDYGLTYEPANIVVTAGAKHVLYGVLRTLVDPGDEVILPAPYWVSYYELIKMVGGVPVVVETTAETGFKMSAAQLEAAISPKTKALILNDPSNPTGMVYDGAALAELAKVCLAHDLYVVADEIYDKLLFDGRSFTSFASLGEDVKRHAQPGLGQRHGGEAVLDARDALPRHDVLRREAAGVVGLPTGQDVDVPLRLQDGQRHGAPGRQGMGGGQHEHQRVPSKTVPVVRAVPLADEAEVDPVLVQCLDQGGAGALGEPEGDGRMQRPEAGDQLRHPPRVGAVVRADRHRPGVQPLQRRRRLAAAVRLEDHLPYGGQERLTRLGRGHAVTAPVQQGEADLLLQGRDRSADAGGGVAEPLGRPGQGPLVQGAEQRRTFLRIHPHPSFLAVSSMSG